MRTLLVHNPTAGTGDHEKEELLAVLRLAGHEVTYTSTKSDEFPKMLEAPFELVVVAGGDGTVRKVVTNLKHRDSALAILPLGTANNIARSLGMTGDRQEMANGWNEGLRERLDVGIAVGPWGEKSFIEGVGIGALAATVSEEVGSDFEGDKRILIGRDAFRKELKEAKPLDLQLTIDGKPLKGDFLMIEILNNRYTGPALPLVPNASPGDGTFDIVVVPEKKRDDMLAWLGKPENSKPPVEIKRGKVITLEWSGKPLLRVDDALVKSGKGDQKAEIRLHEEPLIIMRWRPSGRKTTRKGRKKSGRKKASGEEAKRPLEEA